MTTRPQSIYKLAGRLPVALALLAATGAAGAQTWRCETADGQVESVTAHAPRPPRRRAPGRGRPPRRGPRRRRTSRHAARAARRRPAYR